MFRKFFLTFCFLFLFLPVYSLGGVLTGSSSPLHVIRTEFFDIIFPVECRESAQKIAAVCDDYYLEITQILETEADRRFPVTITRSVEALNAYYAAVPYNRIVLYDTLPEESLDMYENTIQKIFYHELTHAVTYNMRDEKYKKSIRYKIASFIGDAFNPPFPWLTITTFWAEGATVSFESKGKGGRLNDPFSTQLANQSVIEGHFPSWRDVTGSRDTYPGGTDAYIFGAMFASYLQETYGMSKYADFWKNAGTNCPLSLIAGVFKKTYGFKISDAWNDFEKTLYIDADEKNAELLSKKKSRVTAMDSYFDKECSELKIAYFDSLSSSVRLLTINSDGKVKKNKKLLAITGISRLAFSSDGKKLALSRTISRKNSKCVLAEYDIKKGKYKENSLNGLKDGYLRLSNGKEELVGVRIEGAEARGNAALLLNNEEIPFSPIAIDNNLYGAIIKDCLKWKLRLFDEKNVFCEYDFSKIAGDENERNLIVHNLHLVPGDSASIVLSFTWAELGKGGKMLSRLGFVKIDRVSKKANVFLQKKNSFAGMLDIVSPNFSSDSDSFTVYVIAAEYDKNPLYRFDMKIDDFEEVEIKAVVAEDISLPVSDSINPVQKSNLDANSEVKNYSEISYNPFRYYRRGIFLPLVGQVPVYNHDFEVDTNTIFGLTFISTNPWGDRQITFSAGYDLLYDKYGSSILLKGGDDSFKYSLSGTCVFDKDQFMQASESLLLNKILWTGKVSSLSAGMDWKCLYGKQICDDELEKGRDDSVGRSEDLIAFVQFSNIHKISPAVYNSAGFILKPFLINSYRDTENRFYVDKYINAGATAQVRFPILVPFIFTASLFPTETYVASGSVKAILFDFEINKGIPAVSLFVQRLLVSATYSGKISYIHDEFWDCKRTQEIFENVKKEDYSDSIKLAADFIISPNTGFLADLFQFSLGYAMLYRPNPSLTEKRIAYGITASLNY